MRKRSRALYRIGKILEPVGYVLSRLGQRLQYWAMNLWDANCSCAKCLKREKRNAELDEAQFFKELKQAIRRRYQLNGK